MYRYLKKILFKLDPETAHRLTLNSLRLAHKLYLTKLLPKAVTKPCEVMGLTFSNRIGIAAGLDNNADYVDALGSLHPGFIEVGGVTPKPQAGNPRPRIFRLVDQQGIINRMGFCNKGVDYIAKRLEQINYRGIIGVNITKNRDMALENAVDDYLYCFRRCWKQADYIAVNVSSPNTPGLRQLQQVELLAPILSALKTEQALVAAQQHKYVPLVVKISPDIQLEQLADIAKLLLELQIDGVIATNTTLQRTGVEQSPYANEQGGLSGKPLYLHSTEVVRQLYALVGSQLPIIAVGGIFSAADAREKLAAGASLLQVYTGLVYRGPGLIGELANL